jgi:hypothetical protein
MGAISAWNFPSVLGWNNHSNNNSHHDDDRNTHLDLRINNWEHTKKIIYFDDLKPGDTKTYTTTLKVNDHAKIYLHLKDLTPSQGKQTEPEILEENGVPKFDLQNYLTYDLSPVGILGLSLPDAVSCWIPLGSISKNHQTSIVQTFHFPSSVSNWAQGDKLTFTEEFMAVAKNAPVPVTGTGRIWDSTLKKCVNDAPQGASPTPTITPKPTKNHDRR